MRLIRALGLGALAIAIAATLIGWNVSRFIGAEARIRTKQLAFLPSPAITQALALGHRNTAAKLRWIDSFAYFEYQLDRRDDRVAGNGQGAFQRLYDSLIHLDPRYRPFYEHAVLNTGSILGQHRIALGYIMHGLIHMPHDVQIWRMGAAELSVNYKLEERHPEQLDAYLTHWEQAVEDPLDKRSVRDWKVMMSRRRFTGLEQLPYWITQLQGAKPGTPTSAFLEGCAREQIAKYGVAELQAVCDAWKRSHGTPPLDLSVASDPALVLTRHPERLPPYGPWRLDGGRIVLRADPFGLAYVIDAATGTVYSPGYEHRRHEGQIGALTAAIEEKAKDLGRWPDSIADVQAMGIALPPLPAGGRWVLAGKGLDIVWSARETPIDIRQLFGIEAGG